MLFASAIDGGNRYSSFEIIALTLISGAIALYGFFLARRELKRPRTILAFSKLLEHMRFEMANYHTRKDKLFERFDEEVLNENGFLSAVKSFAASGEREPLYRALNEKQDALGLDDESYRALLNYARSLGRGDLSEENERAKRLQEFLERRAQVFDAESRSKARLYRAAGLLIGASAFLLFC